MLDVDGHIEKIDAPWVFETIAEKFDHSALNVIDSGSLVFGGAVRDALAGLPLKGDLDIVVLPYLWAAVCNKLDQSPKWLRIGTGHKKGKAKPSSPRLVAVTNIPGGTTDQFNHQFERLDPPEDLDQGPVSEGDPISKSEAAYAKAKNLPINHQIRYGSVNGSVVQIISSKPDGDISIISPLINVVRSVDIVCCGLAMDREGDVYELVEGAYNDCKNRTLRLNDRIIDTVPIDRLKARIDKLTNRGWISDIDLEKINTKRNRIMGKVGKESSSSIRKSGGAVDYTNFNTSWFDTTLDWKKDL